MTTEPQDEPRTTRRGVLLGVGLAGLGGVLAGCSTQAVPYDANESGQLPGEQSSPSASMMGTTAANGGNGSMGSGSSGMGDSGMGSSSGSSGAMTTGKVLGEAKDIPVGGGMVFTAAQVVVTQPTKGKYHAFSAVCTHVGCIVNKVAAGTIDCPCHGSTFRVTDGAVVTGPAETPLAPKHVKVEGGKVVLLS
jgi:nitrite reductase/ring-hydroxylating ferredoxin subunit